MILKLGILGKELKLDLRALKYGVRNITEDKIEGQISK